MSVLLMTILQVNTKRLVKTPLDFVQYISIAPVPILDLLR